MGVQISVQLPCFQFFWLHTQKWNCMKKNFKKHCAPGKNVIMLTSWSCMENRHFKGWKLQSGLGKRAKEAGRGSQWAPGSIWEGFRDQNIGVSASTSVLPMNIQDWFPLGWTGWISLYSKGLSRVFSNTTVQKHQFFSAQLSSQSNSHIHTWPLEKP